MATLGTFRAYANADCKGDKIKLPESVSQRLLSIPNISYPLCFELSIPLSREDILNAMQNGLPKPQHISIHCGILDFTSGEGCVCLPQWIMDNLNIADSFVLNVSNITLPKGRYVRLQPHSFIKDKQTKQKLESALRNFTTLTAHTTITIEAMNDMKLNILEVKPNKNNLESITIVDTDLIVEFETALDGTTDTHDRFERDLFIDNSDKMTDIITDKVKKGQFRFYKLCLDQSIDNIRIKVSPTNNANNDCDLDLYASWDNSEPGTNNENYDFHCIEHGSAQLNIVNDSNNDCLHISVHGFDDSNESKENNESIIDYTLEVTNISMNDIEIKELHRASSLKTHEIIKKENESKQSNESEPFSADPNKQFCLNCHRFVNKWSHDRHYSHCIKQFKYCNACKKVLPIAEWDTHNKTLHNDLKCKMCEETIKGGKATLVSHMKYECLRRPVSCQYCLLPFPFIALSEHESMCGARTELCVHCKAYIALSVIEQHTIDVHGCVYEVPMGMARMKSDESSVDNNGMVLGGFGAPDRPYNEMSANTGGNGRGSDALERWICSSCDYNNRPNHRQCKICKAKRTKYMKKVSEIFESKKKVSPQKRTEEIGGNIENIPTRNYEDMLNKSDGLNAEISNVKAPLIQYSEKQSNKNKKKREEIVVSSGMDPSQIPQRDYDKMLKAEEIDDTAAFITMNTNTDTNDVTMAENDGNNDGNDIVIPKRDYENMLSQQQKQEFDPEMEQKLLIEKLVSENFQKNKKSAQYRADSAIVPQRDYNKMMVNTVANDNDISMSNNERQSQSSDVKMVSDRRGYWVCPSDDCDYLNKGTRNNCSVCHTLKPTYRRTAELMDDSVDQLGLENRWVCKGCDGLNKGSRNKCVYCKETKAYKPNSKSAVKKVIESSQKYKSKIETGIFTDIERWVCPNKECNFLNKGSRLQCQVCHCERTDAHIVWGDKAKNDMDLDKEVLVSVDKNKKQKKEAYSHPLEARMMGMDVEEIHNVKVGGKEESNVNNNVEVGCVEWPCPICTFLNKEAKCVMCGCPKDAQ